MLAIDAGLTDAAGQPKPRRRTSHKRGQGVASQQAVEGLVGIISLGLQAVSEVAASASEVPEVALLAGETDKDPGEAEILALLPAQWMAKTSFGREVGKYLISNEHKAVALTLIAYVMRVTPPLYAKVRAADERRRKNAPSPRRSPVQAQPAGGNAGSERGNIIPITPGGVFGPILPSRAAANGAYPDREQPAIPVPHL